MPKQDIYYAPIHKRLQKYIPCNVKFCGRNAKHQYGKRNIDNEGYDVKLLCDEHMNKIVITTNPEPNEEHWCYKHFRRNK